MSFAFPQLLAFLDEEKDQVEFMKIAAEVGLGNADIELAKLFVALQLYKAYYAKIPREIKAVHTDALHEFRLLKEEVASFADRTAADASEIGAKADEIRRALKSIDPTEVARLLHKRLVDETLSAIGGTLQTLATAQKRIDAATHAMNEAGYQAAVAIETWQTISLRRVWASAFCACLAASLLIIAVIWFVFLRHQS